MSVYDAVKNAVLNAFSTYRMARSRVTDQYLPKESQVFATVPTNTPKDTEVYMVVTPPTDYIFKIRYFKLTTPLEVQGNILGTGIDGSQVRLLRDNQAEGLTDQLYDSSDWDSEAFFLQQFTLYGIVTADPVTTADRQLILKFSGSLIRYQV
jgi:hypothetical protein